MKFDLTFKGLSFAQARRLMELAAQAGLDKLFVEPAGGDLETARANVGQERRAEPRAEAAPAAPGPTQTGTRGGSDPMRQVPAASASPSPAAPPPSPGTSAATTAPSREPGEDDGPPLAADVEAYYRLTTPRAVVKRIVEEEKITDERAVVARVLALKAAGLPVLEAIPDEAIPDRVAPALAALGL